MGRAHFTITPAMKTEMDLRVDPNLAKLPPQVAGALATSNERHHGDPVARGIVFQAGGDGALMNHAREIAPPPTPQNPPV